MHQPSDRRLHGTVMQAYERAKSLDLTMVRRKLMDEQHGLGWGQEKTAEAEDLYLRFLALQTASSSSTHKVVPPRVVDEFWHQHILDTRKYAADCESIFGEYLHHFPYFGMRGPEDERALQASCAWTRALFGEHFGTRVGRLVECSSCGSCSSCGRSG